MLLAVHSEQKHPCPVSSDTEDMISSREYTPLLFARGMRTDQGKGHAWLTFQTPFIAAECYDLGFWWTIKVVTNSSVYDSESAFPISSKAGL
jgi:hypothetical protein